jgi:hypothetical protein
LSGGVANNQQWQDYWRQLIVYPSSTYDAPSGAVGRRFVEKLAELLDGIRDRKLNSEKFIVFQIVIMQRSHDVQQAKDIRKRISRRLDAWEEGKFSMLIQDTVRAMKSFLLAKRGGDVTTEHVTLVAVHLPRVAIACRTVARQSLARCSYKVAASEQQQPSDSLTIVIVPLALHPMLHGTDRLLTSSTNRDASTDCSTCQYVRFHTFFRYRHSLCSDKHAITGQFLKFPHQCSLAR